MKVADVLAQSARIQRHKSVCGGSSERFSGRHGGWLCLVGVVVLAASCSSNPSPELVMAGLDEKESFGITMPDTTAHEPYSFTAIPLCLAEPGRVRIVGAAVVNPRGLVVDHAAVAPWSRRFPGNAYTTLRRMGFRPGRQVVDTACPDRTHSAGEGMYELGLQFHRRGSGTARGDAVDLQYRTVDGEQGTLRIPFTVTLCAIGETRGGCRPAGRPDPYSR